MRTKEQFKEYVYAKAADKKSDNRKKKLIWIRCTAAFSLLVIFGGVFVYRNSSRNDNAAQSANNKGYGALADGMYFSKSTNENGSYDEDAVYVAEYAAEVYDLQAVVCGEAENESIKLSSDVTEYTKEEVKSFSFEEEKLTYLSEGDGVVTRGFVNTNVSQIYDADDALAIAENEVTIDYNQTSVSYDSNADVWKIVFSTEGTLGNCQSVYLNGSGTTCLIVYGE